MWKWALGALIASGIIYVIYEYLDAGLNTRPEMPKGAFSISYKNGMRAILTGVPNERFSRRYFGYPADVPFYLEKAWSFCNPPTEGESAEFKSAREHNPGERLEGICLIDVDGEIIMRGFITSVPKL